MANVCNIDSDIIALRDVLIHKNWIYSIPTFQREFVWGEKEVKELFEDWGEHTEGFSLDLKKLDGYLLGNIVLVSEKKNDHKSVVDGQQRLTTLTLIVKALENAFQSKMDETNNQDHRAYLMANVQKLKTAYGRFEKKDLQLILDELHIQHDPELNFGTVYRDIMKGESLDDILDLSPSDRNIKEVYNAIEAEIDGWNSEKLDYLVEYMLNYVVLIVTVAPSMSKAFQLFEVLNDRGKSLEALDLIKNLFLKKIDRDNTGSGNSNKFIENWNGFKKNLALGTKKISGSIFLRHYIIGMEGKNLKKDKLFQYFANEDQLTIEDIMNLSEDLKKKSIIYSDINQGKYNSFLKEDKDNLMYILFEVLKANQVQSILIPFYDSDNAMKKRLLDTLIRWYASVIFSFSQTNVIEKTIPELIREYNEEVVTCESIAFDNLLKKLEALIKQYATVAKSVLCTKSFKVSSNNNGKVGNLLKFIELYHHKNQDVISTGSTVEHILSCNIKVTNDSLLGMNDESDFLEHLNLLGNLTLLERELNSGAGDSPFEDKLQYYEESRFILAKILKEPIKSSIKKKSEFNERINKYLPHHKPSPNGHWTKDKIEKRSEELANYFYCIVCNEWI